jgi:hypothetical protein
MRNWSLLLSLISSALFLAVLVDEPHKMLLVHPRDLVGGRLVAKEASLRLIVGDTDAALQALQSIASRFGGRAASIQSWTVSDSGRTYKAASVTLHLPGDNFEAGLLAIRRLSLQVMAEAASGTDRTKEIVDLESSLRSLQANRQRLSGLMQVTQGGVESLRIQEELLAVETYLSQTSASLTLLRQSVSEAMVSIELEPFVPTPTPEPVLTAPPVISPTSFPTGTPTPWDPALIYRDALDTTSYTNWLWVCLYVLLAVGGAIGLMGWAIRRGSKKGGQ